MVKNLNRQEADQLAFEDLNSGQLRTNPVSGRVEGMIELSGILQVGNPLLPRDFKMF